MNKERMYNEAALYAPEAHTPHEAVGPTKYIYDLRSAYRDGYRSGFATAFTPSFYVGAITGVAATILSVALTTWLMS